MNNNLLRDLTLAFSAGALGALINSLFVWLAGGLGITAALGLRIAPDLTPAWLYPRLVWGGIWGFLLVLPLLRGSWVRRGLLFSLGPSLALLFIFFPWKTPAGVGGLGLGALTPLFVFIANAVWGLVAAWWFTTVGRRYG